MTRVCCQLFLAVSSNLQRVRGQEFEFEGDVSNLTFTSEIDEDLVKIKKLAATVVLITFFVAECTFK